MFCFQKSLSAGTFIIFLIIQCIGCTSTPINLNPQLNIIETNIGSGKLVFLHVNDDRLEEEISEGYEVVFGPVSGKTELEKDQSITKMFQDKISKGLEKKGFKVLVINEKGHDGLIVEIRRINTSHRYAPVVRIGFVSAQSVIKARCSSARGKYERNYRAETETSHLEDAGRKDKETLLNYVIAKVLEEMIQDKKLIECLRVTNI